MGTNSVIAAKIKGAYKLGQFFKFDGGDNEEIITKLFEKYGEQDICTALEKLEWLTTTDTEEYAKSLGVQYEKEKDYFPNWNEFEHFRSCYPQYDHTARADRLLNYIMDGTIKKVPDYTKALEAKDVDFQYIMNFDTGKIEVYKFGEFREAIPFPEKKTPELVGITVRYSNGSTKEMEIVLNKMQQIFGLDPEYNKKMEEQARQLHEKALAGKWCCTCEYCIPVDPNLPGFVTAFPECEYGGMAVETCSRYRVAGTAIRNSAWADRIRERFMRVV